MDAPELIAHRGWARRFPENTLAAFEAAIAAGARFVETDVQLSRDRVPFLFHDRTLERVCGASGRLADLDSGEVERLRAGERQRFGERYADEPVATLERFVASLTRSAGVFAFVELKRASIEAFGAEAVLDAVLPRLDAIARRCALISFDAGVLALARKRTRLPLGAVLVDWAQQNGREIRALAPDYVFCDDEKLPARGSIATEGSRLAVYEVDDAARALALAERGADLIETFAIGEMLRALAEWPR